MKFNLNAGSVGANQLSAKSPRSNEAPPTATVTAHPAPAVPLSVYRELAAELQATQAMLDSLHAQNQHLRKQNQGLQHEVEVIVQSTHKMQRIAGVTPGLTTNARPEVPTVAPTRAVEPAAPSSTSSTLVPAQQIASLNKLFTGQEEIMPRPDLSPERSGEISGWWLIGLIVLIVLSAFGTGFLLVKPFLNPQR